MTSAEFTLWLTGDEDSMATDESTRKKKAQADFLMEQIFPK